MSALKASPEHLQVLLKAARRNLAEARGSAANWAADPECEPYASWTEAAWWWSHVAELLDEAITWPHLSAFDGKSWEDKAMEAAGIARQQSELAQTKERLTRLEGNLPPGGHHLRLIA